MGKSSSARRHPPHASIMAFNVGAIRAVMGLDTSDYARGIINAESLNRVFGQSFAAFVSNPLLGSIDVLKRVGTGFIRVSKDILATAEDVQRLGQNTGATSELIEALRGKMVQIGKSTEQSDLAIQRFSANLGKAQSQGGAAADMFQRVGVSIEELRGLNTDDALRSVLDGIQSLDNEAERLNASMELLGFRAGPFLVNAIGGGSAALNDIVQEMRDLGVVTRGGVDDLASLNTSMGRLEQGVRGVRNQLISQFLQGFADEAEISDEKIQTFFRSLQDDLIPAMRQVGQNAANAATEVREFFAAVNDVISLPERAGRALGDFLAPVGSPQAASIGRTELEGERTFQEANPQLFTVEALRRRAAGR